MPHWIIAVNVLNNLWLKVFCKRAGKRDKITYLEAFMLLHQEEKKSEGTHFGPRATSMAGIFPLCQCPVRSQEAPLDLGNLTLISPPEPWVTLTVGNKLTDFVIWCHISLETPRQHRRHLNLSLPLEFHSFSQLLDCRWLKPREFLTGLCK